MNIFKTTFKKSIRLIYWWLVVRGYFIKEIENFGVSRIIYTDINKDGTKKGPNIKDTIELSSKVKIPLVVSGGVSSIADIKKIKSLNNSNIEGVIVGKSIYDGDIKINDLVELI